MIAICLPIGRYAEPKTENCIESLERFTNAAARKQAAALGGTNPDWIEQRAAQLGTLVFRLVGEPIARARNKLTRTALEAGASHLLWIDSDMTFEVDALARLLARRLPIIGGLYFNRRQPYQPQLLRQHDATSELAGGLGFVYDYPENALVEVDATGGGFLLVERRVLEALPEGRWWTEDGNDGENGGGGEDISFCRRARQAGFRVVVDTGVKLGHVGEIEVTEEFARGMRAGHVIARHNVWSGRRERKVTTAPAAPAETETAEASAFPLASIVIPTLNTPPKYLRAAVLSALDQDYPNVEVIVVDAGSSAPDAIPEGARLVKIGTADAPKTIPVALSVGVNEAAGDWIFILQPMDMANPERVQVQLEAFAASGHDCNFALCDTHANENAASWITHQTPRWYTLEAQARYLSETGYVQPSGLAFHRDVWRKVGFFDSALPTLHVWDWTLRVTEAGIHIYKVADTLGVERVSLGRRRDKAELEKVQTLRAQRLAAKADAAKTTETP